MESKDLALPDGVPEHAEPSPPLRVAREAQTGCLGRSNESLLRLCVEVLMPKLRLRLGHHGTSA